VAFPQVRHRIATTQREAGIGIPDVFRHGLDRNAVLKDESESGGVDGTMSRLGGRTCSSDDHR
jgi:hypothetical protein